MASVPILDIILSVFLVAINTKAQTTHSSTIKAGSTLSPNTISSSWSSSSALFSFGFYPQGNGFRVGIWMVNKPENIVVWTANRDDPPYSSNATLELTKTGKLVLRTEKGEEKNIINHNLPNPATSATMLDGGNFQLLNDSGYVMWQSFGYPTDTILGGQVLTSGKRLESSVSRLLDHSRGRFLLLMEEKGNLASYPANLSRISVNSYWSSKTCGNDGAELILNNSGSLFLQSSDRKPLQSLSNGEEKTTSNYRATLDDDGIFRLYSHDIISNTSSRVTVLWSSLENLCEVKGICGFNSFCQGVSNTFECICYPGLVPVNPSKMILGCYQNFSLDGYGDNEEVEQRVTYNIASINNTSWDGPPYTVETLMEEDCKRSCMEDANCWAVMYDSNHCRKYNFPLRYGRKNDDYIRRTGLFKVVLENIAIAKDPNHTRIPVPPNVAESRDKTVFFILALSLGSVACLCFAFAVSSFILYKHKYRRYKKLLENLKLGLAEDFTLQSFSYNELEQATNGFKEEKGRGTFGAVYKGILADQGNKTIAVKRLEKVVEEGIREFRAEMTTIGRTHHKNLVQLLGFCIEGSKKLLVYEFMSNGSLADRLFKSVSQPTWRERVRFVFDVARGIFYLHEECGVHIIHCNLKPQNILLDNTWTAKISDFGLARLLMPNQANTFMGVQVTSLAYFAPEWHKNALISVKSDIYSFGIVLLEIICCRRNIQIDVSTPDEITLSKWVYRCFRSGELHKLVEVEEIDFPTLERMIKVGLWCIQDDPALRPSMKNVILMLEGIMSIPVPPSPEFLVLPSCE